MDLITEHLELWTTAQAPKTGGRGKSANNKSIHGIKKLRELILELAVRGKLVPQDPNDEPASVLLEKIAEVRAQLVKDGRVKKQKTLSEVQDEDQPFDLPKNWVWTRLGLISQINPRNTADDEQVVSFIPMPHIRTSHAGGHGQEQRQWGELKKGYTHFADGDIGVAKITPCFENSKAAVFSNLHNGIGAGTTELHIARPFDDTLNPRYILLYLKSPQFLHVGQTKMTGTAGQKRVPKEFFAGNPLPLPPLSEQHRIVAKVDELMALCDQLEQQQTSSNVTHQSLVETLLAALTRPTEEGGESEQNTLEIFFQNFDTLFTTEHSIDQLKQTILQLAVMGKLVPQNPDDKPASTLLQKNAKEKVRLVKESVLKTKAKVEIGSSEEYINKKSGWEYCRLGNLAKFVDYRGRTPKKIESGVPLITAKNVRFGFISRDPQEFISEDEYLSWMTRGYPRIGDVLFTTEAPLGNVAIVELKEKFALAQRVICFQLHVPEIAPFLKILMMSLSFQEELFDRATGMTATGIKSAKLKEIPIPIPPLTEQHRIVTKVDELMAHCVALKAHLSEARNTQLQLTDAIVEQAVA